VAADIEGTPMRQTAVIAAAALLAALAACSKPAEPAGAPAAAEAAAPAAATPGAELPAGDPQRAALQTVIDARLTKELGDVPAKVNLEIVRVDGDWAFASGPAVSSPTGEELDFHATALRERAEAGVIDGNNTLVLLKREGGTWKVVEMAIGPTDVAQIEWVTKHGVPNALVGLEDAEGGQE